MPINQDVHADRIVFPVELIVRPWNPADPAPRPVFPVQHPYVEMIWLPVIGPSATWALRRLAGWASAFPDGTAVVLPELSESLGLGATSGPASSVQRTLRRLVMFRLARWSDALEVRTTVPAVSERHLARLSSGLVHAHDRMTTRVDAA
jgi:hypothetical protein